MFGNEKIKQKILQNTNPYQYDRLFQRFIDILYFYIPTHNQKTLIEIEDLSNIAVSIYDFFKTRSKKKHSINFVLSQDAYTQEELVTAIIVNDEMHFLVDSLTEYLNQHSYHLRCMVNAGFDVKRDEKGHLTDIGVVSTSVSNESVIYLTIVHSGAENFLIELEKELNQILDTVRVVVDDWPKNLALVEQCIIGLNGCDKASEEQAFLKWLIEGNFTFIGSGSYSIKEYKQYQILDNACGILASDSKKLERTIIEEIFESSDWISKNECLFIGKISTRSIVHRNTNLDYVCVIQRLAKGDVRATVFLGLLSNKLDNHSIFTVPIIRKVVTEVTEKAHFKRNSFNAKEIVSILGTLPKEVLFQSNADELFKQTMAILSCNHSPRLLVFVQKNRCRKFVDVMVFFPRNRMRADIAKIIQEVVNKNITCEVIKHEVSFSSIGLAYVHLCLFVDDNQELNISVDKLHRTLDDATHCWDEHYYLHLKNYFGPLKASRLLPKYQDAFDSNYKTQFSSQNSIYDVAVIEKLLAGKEQVLFRISDHGQNNWRLKIYSLKHKVSLYEVMPILDNFGFLTIEEDVFEVKIVDAKLEVWIHDFVLKMKDKVVDNLGDVRDNLEEAIYVVFNKVAKNDSLNHLVLNAQLKWRHVFLLCAYCQYLLQVNFVYSQDFIRSVLIKHASVTKLLIDLFHKRFDHNAIQDNVSNLEKKIKAALVKISNSAEDRVMRCFFNLIEATIRTNYFQLHQDQTYKSYVSLKIDSQKLEGIPLPRPYVEIFVYALEMEGIHLRGGKISRGGIRWSDRVEDYRTEVLGLMKAQMTKNTIIVPDGAKGGFLVKNAFDGMMREELQKLGIESYKTLLRGMLDITDNLFNGKVVKPKQVVCKDGDDPYLVVAADKGTATFSDIANALAVDEYNFWLRDAFASGGSSGYDHKEMAITAKGAWISVQHHFSRLGIDPYKDPFTVVGIGDMAGDVFGNGLLLSNQIKLVAAFNHKHIFIDPKPDHLSSYKERKRLFNMIGSSWADYNQTLISAGGGVFERQVKSIKLTKEIKTLLDIEENNVDPDTLIIHILKAKVDLIWNGGIGTYVKAITETQEQIGDKNNDNLRINGNDLRCKVFAEGGNLGVTQLGRIEYLFNGGMINTDSIDNSGGVDCSDHEVNIKIALNKAVDSGKLSIAKRDKILVEMKPEVAQLVLSDNAIQNQNIAVSQENSVRNFDSYIKLIASLKDSVGLDPSLEYLPNKAEIARRIQNNLGFSRAEIAVLMAYSKRAVYNMVIDSKVPDDSFYNNTLLSYFPKRMREEFVSEIINHPLRREIISTALTNHLINHSGINFFHIAKNVTGQQGGNIILAYSVVWQIFDLDKIWQDIAKIQDYQLYVELYTVVRSLIQRAVFWFLDNQLQPLDVTKTIAKFKPDIDQIIIKIDRIFTSDLSEEYKHKLSHFVELEVDDNIATRITRLYYLCKILDIAYVADKTQHNIKEVARVYFEIGKKLHYHWIDGQTDKLVVKGYWQKMLIKSIKDDISMQHRRMAVSIIKQAGNGLIDVTEKWAAKNVTKLETLDNFIKSLMSMDNIDYAQLIVAVKQSNMLLE